MLKLKFGSFFKMFLMFIFVSSFQTNARGRTSEKARKQNFWKKYLTLA